MKVLKHCFESVLAGSHFLNIVLINSLVKAFKEFKPNRKELDFPVSRKNQWKLSNSYSQIIRNPYYESFALL